jgi:hypothetical protein
MHLHMRSKAIFPHGRLPITCPKIVAWSKPGRNRPGSAAMLDDSRQPEALGRAVSSPFVRAGTLRQSAAPGHFA